MHMLNFRLTGQLWRYTAHRDTEDLTSRRLEADLITFFPKCRYFAKMIDARSIALERQRYALLLAYT